MRVQAQGKGMAGDDSVGLGLGCTPDRQRKVAPTPKEHGSTSPRHNTRADAGVRRRD